MDVIKIVSKIKGIAEDVKALLPKYGKADLTLELETLDELKASAICLNTNIFKPSDLIPFFWYTYKTGPVLVTVQVPAPEKQLETNNFKQN